MAFDSVVSIGGQSLLDGVWRILQPALQSLTNPLPVSVPGMTNAWVRIRKITPSLLGSTPLRLALLMEVEMRGEILLTASVKAGTLRLVLPNANITIPMPDTPPLPGNLHLPTGDIPVTIPSMTGTIPLPTGNISITLSPEAGVTGHMRLPTGGTFNLPTLSGILNFISGHLDDVGLPLPSVVPLALNLTPATNHALVSVTLPLIPRTPIDVASAFGLLLESGVPRFDPIPSIDATIIASAISNELRLLLTQLGVRLPHPPTFDPAHPSITDLQHPFEPFDGVGPTIEQIGDTAMNITAAARATIQTVVRNALTGLTARTGRLIFPRPADGSPCDVALLPTEARARTSLTRGGVVLQVGFARTGVSQLPFNFPVFTPNGTNDVGVEIGNDFLLELLCCLVEKLPNFTFHAPASTEVTSERNCCKWTGVTLDLWPLALSGTLDLCIVGASNATKKIELVGHFTQNTALIDISVRFTLELNPHLDDACAVTGLPFATATPEVSFKLNPLVVASLVIAAGFLVLLVLAPGFNFIIPTLGVLLSLIPLLIGFVEAQLRAVADSVFNTVRALTSPVAIPPGFFEAFGRLVPVSVVLDDLTAQGVLATPTSPWALTPINATLPMPLKHPDPEEGGQSLDTHVTASVGGEFQGSQ